MNLVIATGCPHSGWETVLSLLTAASSSTVSSPVPFSYDQLFYETDLVSLNQPMSLDVTQREQLAAFLKHTESENLLFAESRNLWLLDDLAECLPQAKFLLFYNRIEIATAHAFGTGIEPNLFLATWQAANRQLLQFQRHHRQRAYLLDVEVVRQNPQEFIEFCLRYGLILSALPPNFPCPDPNLPEEGILAGTILSAQSEVASLSAELEASSIPLGEKFLPESLQPTALYSKYLIRQNAANEQITRCEQLLSENQQLVENYQSIKTTLQSATQENELLLLQMCQLQEEIETIFAEKQHLELACLNTQQKQDPVEKRSSGASAVIPENKHVKQQTAKAENKTTSGLAKILSLPKGDDGKKRAKRELAQQIQLIHESGLFDAEWYLNQYPDVAKSGIIPVKHYLCHGAAEGRDPSPNFSTRYYLARNQDVALSGTNPLLHYVLYGKSEGRQPKSPHLW